MSKKPKIAIVGSFPIWLTEPELPHPGGHYAVWLMALYEALQSIDTYDIHWVCMSKGLRHGREVRHGNQIFHILSADSLELASRTRFIWDRLRLHRLFKRLKPDIVHAWGTENRWAMGTSDFHGKKILSMQGILTAYDRLSPMGAYMHRQAATEASLLPRFDLITSESEWGCRQCRLISPQSAIARWEYAAEERFFSVPRKLTATPTCLLAGSDTPIKNVDTAIRAFSAPELSHIQLLLAGISPENRPDLPPNICALGRVNREQMTELISGAWALVHPTLADTSPNIIKEARVVGIPVVTTTECGGAQYIDEGKSGYTIAPLDVSALRQAVLNMTKDAETSLRMGAWKHEECRRLLSKNTMLDRLLEIYEAVLNNRISELQ